MKNLKLVAALALVAALVAGPVTAQGDGASEIALDFLQAQMIAEGGTAADVADARITDQYTSAHNGVTHVYVAQVHEDRRVIGANATVNVRDGEVLHGAATFLTDIDQKATGIQVLSVEQAALAAAQSVDLSASLARTDHAELVYQATDGQARLAWNVDVYSVDHAYNISVDAQTGEVLQTRDRVDHDDAADIVASVQREDESADLRAALDVQAVLPPEQAEDGSSYEVFPIPMENPFDGDRQIVSNPADGIHSPFGWHDLDGVEGADTTITQGNNVHAYVDSISTSLPVRYIGPGNEVPNSVLDLIVETEGGDPMSEGQGGEDLTFSDPINYDTTPSSYRAAAVTNLFYWSNVIHDVTARYGFTEAAGNFQEVNYSGQGLGGDSINAEAQDGSGANNANFFTPADGTSGRMQMYIWPNASETRDGDLDAGIIAHEYGHGISNRLIGGPSQVDCIGGYAESEGEGISDFFSYALTMLDGETGADPRGVGNYVLHQERRNDDGIRPTPYSTDRSVNPSSYNSINGAAQPHGVGYVWATIMWDVYWALVDQHGFNQNVYEDWSTGGNNRAIQLLMDGMKFAPCDPSFVELRDAILAADMALTGPTADLPSESYCSLWDGFAGRGLGIDADAGDKTRANDQTESYDVPAICQQS